MGTVGVYVGRSNGGVNELISIVSAAVVVWGSSEEYNSGIFTETGSGILTCSGIVTGSGIDTGSGIV